MTEIIVALIALIGTLCGSLGGVLVSSKMTNYRLLQLENKVAEHNNFARRMPVVEEQIKVANHRIDDLERKNDFAKLLSVKSIVTIILTFNFAILTVMGKINSEQFIMIFTTVIAFYFGTQHEKNNTEE